MQILIVSGGMGAVRLDSTEIFDPDLGSWSAGAALPMKYGINGLKSATIDNRVFIFGKAFFAIYNCITIVIASQYLQVVMTEVIGSTPFWSMTSPATPTHRLGP